MPRITHSVTINKPISKVFRFATSFDTIPQWQTDTRSLHPSDDKARAGIFFTHNRKTRLLSWKLDLNADIVEFQNNKLVVYKGVLGHFRTTDTLQFQASGRTTKITETIDIGMRFYFMFSPWMKSVMSRRTKNTLNKLKELMESGAADAPPA